MKHRIAPLALTAAILITSSGLTFADNLALTPGQPNQSCQATNPPNFPGNTANAPGSAFNGTAGGKYAGNGQNTQTPANFHAVAQYDVACAQQTAHLP